MRDRWLLEIWEDHGPYMWSWITNEADALRLFYEVEVAGSTYVRLSHMRWTSSWTEPSLPKVRRFVPGEILMRFEDPEDA
jgi:hypothetical protein